MNDRLLLCGVDVGGSGIKGAVVDAAAGVLASNRVRVTTPEPSTPVTVAAAVTAVVRELAWEGALGVAVPAVVRGGVVRTAANIDKTWIGTDAARLLREHTGQAVRVLNDADAAGMAEMRFGAGKEVTGLVIMLTFGTGIGSALFYDGVLLPNSELGHLEFRGAAAETYAAGRLVKRDEMDLTDWAGRVNDYLSYVERILSPDLIVFGGGISKRFREFAHLLDVTTPIHAAELRNNAGIVGAALAGGDLAGGG